MFLPLKRCPFCDGRADRAQTLDNDWWIYCASCKGNVGYFESEDEAVAAWNSRPRLHKYVKLNEDPGSGLPDWMSPSATLYREVDALGGEVVDLWTQGHHVALEKVLAILTRRGFTEVADARASHDISERLKALEIRDVHDGYDEDGNFVWEQYVLLDEVKRVVSGQA